MAVTNDEVPAPTREGAAVGFGLTLAVLLVGGVLGIDAVSRLADSERVVAHTHELIGELETLLSTLPDAETGPRGFLLTEDEKRLQPYERALQRVADVVARLRKLTADNLA